MAKAAGRLAILSKAGTPIAGVRTTKVAWEGQSIDVTDKDSNGILEVLSLAAGQSVTITVDGVYTSPVLRDVALDTTVSKLLTDLTFKFSDALAAKDTIGGNFWFGKYEEGNPYDDATDFSCEFTSSGTWTFN